MSLVNALSLRGPIAPLTILGTVDGLTFKAHIICRVALKLWPGAVLIMNNSYTYQAMEEVKATLKAVGA